VRPGCNVVVAAHAEGADVIEVAFAAALGDGDDVIGVPEGTAMREGRGAFRTREAAQAAVFRNGIDAAERAYPAIALEDQFTEVAGVGAETPFADAVGGAKGPAAAGR